MLKNLQLKKWNQFDEIYIEFDKRLTILTGANGSGKSSLIRLVANEMGWRYSEIAALDSELNSFISGLPRNQVMKFNKLNKQKKIDFYEKVENTERCLGYEETIDFDSIVFGKLYSDSGVIKYHVPSEVKEASYQVKTTFNSHLENDENHFYEPSIIGVNISSHRQPYSYSKVKNIPVHADNTEMITDNYLDLIKSKVLNEYSYGLEEESTSPVYYMKKILIAWAVFGEGNSIISPNDNYTQLFKGFESILHLVLPVHLKFKHLKVKNGEVVIVTGNNDFLIDAVSGGIGSIIDMAWQVYIYCANVSNPVVVIDEIENHLHPSMQRVILPSLLNAFPDAQFLVSTHSPFIVNSVEDSTVYALRFNENGKVNSIKLNFVDEPQDAFDILKNVLGVPVTYPIWVEEKYNDILDDIEKEEFTLENYKKLKSILNIKSMNSYLPDILDKWGKNND